MTENRAIGFNSTGTGNIVTGKTKEAVFSIGLPEFGQLFSEDGESLWWRGRSGIATCIAAGRSAHRIGDRQDP